MPTGHYQRPPERKCTFAQCNRKHYGRGWCGTHYQQVVGKKKQPTPIRTHLPFKERFASYLRVESGCVVWTGSLDTTGYGTVSPPKDLSKRKMESAHRIAWILANGPIPDGLCVLHTCDNRRCCNPKHLWLGTKGDNNADRTAKGRSARLRGVANGHAMVSEEDVREIRRLRPTTSLKALAERYRISSSAVHAIAARVNWKHIL